jgi:hypothetical protein
VKDKMTSSDNPQEEIGIESLKDILEKTLSNSSIELLLLYLKENGAIHGGKIEMQRFQDGMKELFGEGAAIFFELLQDLSIKKVPVRKRAATYLQSVPNGHMIQDR